MQQLAAGIARHYEDEDEGDAVSGSDIESNSESSTNTESDAELTTESDLEANAESIPAPASALKSDPNSASV